jgi:hypothetical protein
MCIGYAAVHKLGIALVQISCERSITRFGNATPARVLGVECPHHSLDELMLRRPLVRDLRRVLGCLRSGSCRWQMRAVDLAQRAQATLRRPTNQVLSKTLPRHELQRPELREFRCRSVQGSADPFRICDFSDRLVVRSIFKNATVSGDG